MKKIILTILTLPILLMITSCGHQTNVNLDELENINNKIIEYYTKSDNQEYNNLSFHYIDEENKVIVVGLLENTKEQQDKFKQLVVDSNYIKFVQGKTLENHQENSKEELPSFIRTYNILNIADSNDETFIYLTIRQFQGEEVETIKVKKDLCSNITVGKNYEFTIKPTRKIEDTIRWIFDNSEVVSIKETDKIGLEQIQEALP